MIKTCRHGAESGSVEAYRVFHPKLFVHRDITRNVIANPEVWIEGIYCCRVDRSNSCSYIVHVIRVYPRNDRYDGRCATDRLRFSKRIALPCFTLALYFVVYALIFPHNTQSLHWVKGKLEHYVLQKNQISNSYLFVQYRFLQSKPNFLFFIVFNIALTKKKHFVWDAKWKIAQE